MHYSLSYFIAHLWNNLPLSTKSAPLVQHFRLLIKNVHYKACQVSYLLYQQAISKFPGPMFQNEVKCSAFDMEIILHSHANKTHFHKKGCAPTLIWKWGFLELGSGLLPLVYTHSVILVI